MPAADDLHDSAIAPPTLPAQCDVLVVGAGPAGSACAQQLARAGLDVCLVDQQVFPRDKVCGDGLIPDAHEAFERLGVARDVMAAAQPVSHVACVAPRGGRARVRGRLAVLPRRVLDDILKRAAERAGARFFAPWRFDAPLRDEAGRVVGARLKAPQADGGAVREVRARWVVLATGAVPQALIAAGVCERHTPSGVALRGYVRHPGLVGRVTDLEVVWHKRLRQGYGWIFPGPDGVFNIGTGLAHSHARRADGRGRMAEVNLRELFATFCDVHPAARELMTGGELLGDLKGAPLRCSLEGAQLAAPGLLVTGEAAGSTYAFTGEGIGKAMETGMLAAAALTAEAADDAVMARYRAGVQALKPRFALYDRAGRVNHHPWIADLLIWRAQRSASIMRRMEGVLEETHNPGNLVTLRGLARLLLPSR